MLVSAISDMYIGAITQKLPVDIPVGEVRFENSFIPLKKYSPTKNLPKYKAPGEFAKISVVHAKMKGMSINKAVYFRPIASAMAPVGMAPKKAPIASNELTHVSENNQKKIN